MDASSAAALEASHPRHYNWFVKRRYFILTLTLLLAGCRKDIENKDAVRKGVIDYLTKGMNRTGLDMSRMDVDVSSVKFQKDEAQAEVRVAPKGETSGGMSMNYVLERRGNEWIVKGRKESGLNPHGAGGLPAEAPALPPNHPPTDGARPESPK